MVQLNPYKNGIAQI